MVKFVGCDVVYVIDIDVFRFIFLIVGFGILVVIFMFIRLLYMSILLDKLKLYLVYFLFIGIYYVWFLFYFFGNVVIVGQLLYVIMFVVLNIVMVVVGYKFVQFNVWFVNEWQEVMGYFFVRIGVLVFVLMFFVILFFGCNNIFFWVINWFYLIFMVFYWWVVWIYVVQVIIYLVVELVLYIDMEFYEVEFKMEYWVWGIVVIVFVCVMLVFSLFFFRWWLYELFFVGYIIMVVFVIVGSWYYVEFLFQCRWGYEFWLYVVCVVWFFDCMIWVFCVFKNGFRWVVVIEVFEDIVWVDVKGIWWIVVFGFYIYVYFLVLSLWRLWENYLFFILFMVFFQFKWDVFLFGVVLGSDMWSIVDVEKLGGVISISVL